MNESVTGSSDSNKDSSANKTRTSQSYFNPFLLLFYDFMLYRFISPYLWGCSSQLLVERYNVLCRNKHLETGVGTGYLLKKCNAPIEKLGLMDLSQACLDKTARRLSHLKPDVWRRNILTPIEGIDQKYQSLSINYVMHCVPGNYTSKGVAFKHLKTLLLDDGVLFGASVIKTDQSNFIAKSFMALLNTLGVFNNTKDTVDDLEAELRRHFKYSHIERRSASVLFIATDCENQYKIHHTEPDSDHFSCFAGCDEGHEPHHS